MMISFESTAMNVVHGDLIKLALGGEFDVIIHGCNCQRAMGAGIAKSIKKAFPEAYEADLETSKGDRKKMGTISTASVKRNNHDITIVNGYTQYHWRGSGVLVDYEALRSVMREVKARFSGKRLGYPKIGAGLAGGDWKVISQIIDQELKGEDHTLVEYAT
jgi:O-acetyl-ADP-ribose deacetylase (regulator of RNase III)